MQANPNAQTLSHPRSAFDTWRAISISLYMTLVGYGVPAGTESGIYTAADLATMDECQLRTTGVSCNAH